MFNGFVGCEMFLVGKEGYGNKDGILLIFFLVLFLVDVVISFVFILVEEVVLK